MMTVDDDGGGGGGDGMNADGERGRENGQVVVHGQRSNISCEAARLRQKVRFWCTMVGWIVQSSPVQRLFNPVQSKGYPIFPTKYSWSIQT